MWKISIKDWEKTVKKLSDVAKTNLKLDWFQKSLGKILESQTDLTSCLPEEVVVVFSGERPRNAWNSEGN